MQAMVDIERIDEEVSSRAREQAPRAGGLPGPLASPPLDGMATEA